MSARDQARFALLYLRGGEWRGRRVLRADLFAEAMDGLLPPNFPRTAGVESRTLKKPGSIGGGKNLMIGNLIGLQFGQGRNWPLGSALSISLMIVVMIALLAYVRYAGKGANAHG